MPSLLFAPLIILTKIQPSFTQVVKVTKYQFWLSLDQISVVWQDNKTIPYYFPDTREKMGNALRKILLRDVVVPIKSYEECTFFIAYLPYWRGYIGDSQKKFISFQGKSKEKKLVIYITKRVKWYFIFDGRSNSSRDTTLENCALFYDSAGLFLENHWTDNQK